MKFKKTVSVLLASAIALPCLAGVAACKSKETGVKGETAYGNKTLTDVVKKPSDDVSIKLIRGKNVLKEGKGSLDYGEALQAGDIIEIESDYKYINVKLFDKLGEQLIYSPSGQFTFQIPGSQTIYDKDTFGGTSHTFTAQKAADSQLSDSRNVAVNPYDYMYIDEVNVQTVADKSMDAKLADSQALSQVAAYPHAYANRVTRNEAGFYARNAIDGGKDASSHGDYPYQSWGYDKKTDAEFTVYFGREVAIDKVGFVLRADYAQSGGKDHDTYWEGVTLQFSDGTTQKIEGFKKNGDLQQFDITQVSTSYVRIKDIKEVQNANSDMYAALTEFEAYGKENKAKNEVAEKTTVTTAFGGKDQSKFKTSDFKYSEIKDIMDKSNAWFINKTESEDYQIFDWSGTSKMQVKINDAEWKDAVYYSGLTESFLTTGDLNSYYFMRAVGNQFKYLNNNGSHTAHGDYFQIGESYLQLNDLKNANYKFADTLANADWNLNRSYDETNFTGYSSAKSSNKKDDWAHMGYWWCDALYMAMNSYTLLTLQTGDAKYANAAYEGYTYWKDVLYNNDYNLWYRDQGEIGTTTKNADPATGKDYPVFWARGNAWVLSALAKQLMYLDKDKFPAMYETYEKDYLKLAESISKYQRTDGTWNASIVDENYFGGKESTGTMGFIYAYCIGLRLGILDSATYYPIVKTAWNGIVENCIFTGVDEEGKNIDGKVGYMQTTGYQPQNYKSEEFSKYNTHEFGMGLFLLACSGMMSICSDYQAPSVIIPADPQAALIG